MENVEAADDAFITTTYIFTKHVPQTRTAPGMDTRWATFSNRDRRPYITGRGGYERFVFGRVFLCRPLSLVLQDRSKYGSTAVWSTESVFVAVLSHGPLRREGANKSPS